MAEKYGWRKENKQTEVGQAEEPSYGWRKESSVDIPTTVTDNITNRVNTWLKNHDTYISNYQNRNDNRKYNYEDSYVSDSADWLKTVSQQKRNFDAEADSILAYMDKFNGYLDADWSKQVRDLLTSARGQQSIVLENSSNDNQWWSNWANEDEYKTSQRYDGYSKKYEGKKYEDIQTALSTLQDGEEKDWLDYFQHDLYEKDNNYNSKATSGLKSYEAQKVIDEKKREEEELPLWLKNLSMGSGYENPVAVGITQAQEAYRSDTSWREPNDKWSDGQKKEFGYLYATDPAKAYQYAEQVNNQINAMAKYEQQQDVGSWASQNFGTGTLGTLGTIATAPLGMADFLDDLIEYGARGTITQKSNLTPFEMGQAAQSGIANKLTDMSGTISDKIPIIGGKGLGDVYSLGVSAANSLVSAYTLGGVGTLVNFIGQGGAAGVDDALSRGATPEQALLYGTITGALEGVTEMIPADELLKIGSSSTIKNFLKKSLNQGFGELIEEGTSSLFTNIADNIIMRDKSNFYATVKELMANGMTEEEAKKKAWKQMAGDIAFDAIGGFATGATNAMTVGGVSTAVDARKGNQKNIDAIKQYGDKTDALIQEGLQNDKKSESYQLATKYQQQTQGKTKKNGKQVDGKAMTGFQIRNLLAANQEQITAKDIEKIEQAAAQRLVQHGQRGDILKTAELATKYATGGKLTKSEKSFLARSQYGAQVASEMLPKNILADDDSGIGNDRFMRKWENDVSQGWGENYSTEWAENIGTEVVNARAYNKKNIDKVRTILKELQNMEDPATYKSLEDRIGAERKYSVSDKGQDTIIESGDAIDLSKAKVVDFVKDKKTGKVVDMVLNADGKEVKASEIAYSDDSKSYLFEAVGNIENITPEDATVIVRDYNPDSGLSVGEYLNGVDESFTYGYHGYSVEDMKAGNFAPKLSDQQAMSAYVLGQNASKNVIEADETTHKRMRTAQQDLSEQELEAQQKARFDADYVEVYFEDGATVVRFDEHNGQYDEKRMAGVNTAKFLSKLGIGSKYYFYESYVKDGERVYKDANGNEVKAPNGMYKEADGSIHIDLNAGDAGQGTTLFTLAHELTHFIKQWNSKKFKVLADFLIEEYGKTDMSMHERVLAKQKELTESRGEDITYDEAFEEVVADSMSTMFTDGNLYEKLTKLKVKDQGLFNKIKQFFDKLIAKFRELYAELTPDQKDAQDIREMKDVFDRIQTAFAEALVEASENYQAKQEVGDIHEDMSNEAAFTDSETAIHNQIRPPYSDGSKAFNAFVEELNPEARKTFDLFYGFYQKSRITNTLSVSGKKVKGVNISSLYLLADEWNDMLSKEQKWADAAKALADFLPENVRKRMNMNEDGTLNPTMLEKEFKMPSSMAQRLVDALAYEKIDANYQLGDKTITLPTVESRQSVGGEAYRRAIIEETRKLYADGKLKKVGIGTMSKDRWGSLGFLAANGKTGASGDFTTVCPQMMFNRGCWYCYRRAAMEKGVNNKLVANSVWYTGEILRIKDSDIEALNRNGGLRIQSFGDWMPHFSAMLADVLYDAELRGLQVKIITKEPSMINYIAALREQGIGKNLYFNLSADYTIERGPAKQGKTVDSLDTVNPERPYLRNTDNGFWWKRAMTVEEANKYRQKYPWVNTRIVATTLDEFIRGLQDSRVDVVTGYHGNIREFERVDSTTGEHKVNVEALGDAGMPRFAFNPATGKWVVEYEGKTQTHKRLAQAIAENNLQMEYYTKTCCITGRCATCEGKCGALARDFNVKNATNRDSESIAYWQKQMQYAIEPEFGDITVDEQAMDGVKYSERTGHSVSNRHLLANAFEGITNGSEEYKLIQKYKGYIAELNSMDEKLSEFNQEIRKIRFGKGEYDAEKLDRLEGEAKKIADAINKYDQYLVSLEASAPLRRVIERERKKEAQKTRDHVKEIQQNKKVRAEQTELRHKIRKTIRDLDKVLNRGNKKLNVKEDMKGFASKALELADYLFTDHISNDELIRRGIDAKLMRGNEAQLVKETEEILSKLYDEADSLTDEEFARLDEKRKANEYKLRDLLTQQRNERLNTPVYNLFNDLVTEYASLKNSKQDAVKAAHDPNVERFLRSYIGESNGETDSDRKTLLQNMRVADMTTDELWRLHNAYKMVLHAVRTANDLFVKGKAASIQEMADRITWDFSKRKTPEGKAAIIARNLANKIGWSYEKLYYALDRIGSDAFTELVMNIANSENIVMQDVMEAAAFRDEMVKNYGFNNWDVNKEIDREFLDNTGKKFKLTLGQMMSLYAYSRRKGAWDHIEYGGFVFGESALTNPKPADSYKLSKAQCEEITSLLTTEQKSYVEAMQKFLSETMGEKGNEVSMLLYGIKMFGEKNYFPIHIAGQFKAQANESQAKQAAGFGTMSNAGFTHAQNPNAKAPFVLESFNEIWVDHVNEMSRYHGTVPALEDMRRVMNRSSYSEATAESMAIKQLMENSYGKEAVDYFDNLYREANSGAITDKLQKTSKKLLSLFRKNSVAYSMSVLVQQPASITRAYAMIDKKYFGFKGFGAITSGVAKVVTDKWTKAHTNTYNKMLKYAPGVTMAKEIGGFDTATGGSIRSYLLDTNKSLKQKWNTGTALEKGKAVMDLVDDNAIANLPNVADKIAWCEIWNACERETVAKHKNLKPGSDEFLKAVGERFTEVIRATQVYDSIFAKSPMLKSKNLAVQMVVSFMNEPNTVANMAESAVRDFVRGDKKVGVKKAAVLIHGIIFTGVLKSIVYAMRDDDEDETYIEKYIESLAGSLMSDFNALNYIPLARDIVSLAQGYDVERADMAIVADALDAVNRVIDNSIKDTDGMTEEQLIEFDKKCTEANWKLAESMAAFFGIPVKNIRREIEGVIDHARIASANRGKTTGTSAWDKISDVVMESIPFMQSKSKQDKLYEAIMEGDKSYLTRLKSTYKKESSYESAVRKALRENDPRIHDAAKARIDGKVDAYKRIFREIQNERKFSFDEIMSAINSEESAIRNKTESDKVKSDYSASDFVDAVIIGDTSTAEAMKAEIISTKVANGRTREEAEEQFASAVYSNTRTAFDDGFLDQAGAKKMLTKYAGKDTEEAAAKVDYWAFCKAHPQYDLSQANVEDYHEIAVPAGISLDVFVQYLNGTKGLVTKYDEWGDVEVSKKEQVLEVIDSLPLTFEQKDALYLAAGYSEDNIWDVPW